MPGSGLGLGQMPEASSRACSTLGCAPIQLNRVKGVASTAWPTPKPPCACVSTDIQALPTHGPRGPCPAGWGHLALPTLGMAPGWVQSLPEQERDRVGLSHPAQHRSAHTRSVVRTRGLTSGCAFMHTLAHASHWEEPSPSVPGALSSSASDVAPLTDHTRPPGAVLSQIWGVWVGGSGEWGQIVA